MDNLLKNEGKKEKEEKRGGKFLIYYKNKVLCELRFILLVNIL